MAKSMWARGPEWTFTAFCRTETVSTFSLRPRARCEWARSSCRTGLSYSPHSCFVLAIRPQRILIVARLEAPTGGDRRMEGRHSTPENAQLSQSDGMSSTWRPAPQRLMKTGSIGSMLCRGVWSRGLRPYWCDLDPSRCKQRGALTGSEGEVCRAPFVFVRNAASSSYADFIITRRRAFSLSPAILLGSRACARGSCLSFPQLA